MLSNKKKLTIGVDLAVRPELLLFLDEPTSGLDSNTAWSVCKTLRRLADSGQSILCTIHQPSGELFEMFDQLLFLGNHGNQVYFGELGNNCRTIITYFEKRGARTCLDSENCAEWLFDVVSAEGTNKAIDWPQEWLQSEEKQKIDRQLQGMKQALLQPAPKIEHDSASTSEYATSFLKQLIQVTHRNFLHDSNIGALHPTYTPRCSLQD